MALHVAFYRSLKSLSHCLLHAIAWAVDMWELGLFMDWQGICRKLQMVINTSLVSCSGSPMHWSVMHRCLYLCYCLKFGGIICKAKMQEHKSIKNSGPPAAGNQVWLIHNHGSNGQDLIMFYMDVISLL